MTSISARRDAMRIALQYLCTLQTERRALRAKRCDSI